MIHTAPIDLSQCEQEPIHIPGAIQSHGILLVLEESGLTVTQLSQNAADVFGIGADDILGMDVDALLKCADKTSTLKQLLKAQNLDAINPFRLITQTKYGALLFEAIAHRNEAGLIVELEPATRESAVNTTEFFRSVSGTINAMLNATDRCQLLDLVAKEVHKITEFDRVMLYEFDDDFNGTVVAEQRTGLCSYLGHKFPASDIPKQARELYRKNHLRLLVNVDDIVCAILPTNNPTSGQPLDLSYSVLRAMSPIHIEYLKNMEAAASLSISIVVKEQLVGLIACHHTEPKFVDYQIRLACRFIAQLLSVRLLSITESALSDYKLKLKNVQHQLMSSMALRSSLVDALTSDLSVLDLTAASGAAVRFAGSLGTVGQVPDSKDINDLLDWLDANCAGVLYKTQSLCQEFAAAIRYKQVASGLLAVRISTIRPDWILWFRPQKLHDVSWAGMPSKSVRLSADGLRLHPRKSFELWKEKVEGQAHPWHQAETESALEMRNLVLDFLISLIEGKRATTF